MLNVDLIMKRPVEQRAKLIFQRTQIAALAEIAIPLGCWDFANVRPQARLEAAFDAALAKSGKDRTPLICGLLLILG